MPDSKITALTALTSADPANDMFPIVDVSDTSMAASGTTKRISINNLLAASGTATLASATITGDLTVDTSTLKVDSANNRVIVGHTSGSSAFQVTNAGAAGFEVQPTGVNSAPAILSYNRSSPAWLQLTYGASSHVFQLSGTDAMTLNSTGLGVQVSPSAPLCVKTRNSDSVGLRVLQSTSGTSGIQFTDDPVTADWGSILATSTSLILRSNSTLLFQTGGATTRATIDTSGNLILQSSSTPATLGTNGMLTVNATSNTNLRFSYRGSDGVTRTADLTLA